MGKMKKLAGAMLAMIMVLAMGVTAFADETYTITISNTDSGYAYTAYQIFKGDVGTDGDTAVLTNIAWGSGINYEDEALLALLVSTYGTTDASEIAALITTQTQAAAFAKIVSGYLTAGTDSEFGTNYTISGLTAGYYLIDNTTVPSGSAYSSDIMVNVLENTTVSPKVDAPSSDKTVDDINDSANTAYTEGQTSADHDIGDEVPFTLTATLPDNYGSYETYLLVFHDVMDAGLTFNADSVKVYVTTNETTTEVSDGYTVATATEGTLRDTTCTFEVQIADTNALLDANGNAILVTAGSVITVKYTAELNENAVIGDPGNANTSHIEYSNNPDWDGEGDEPTGDTPDKTVVVFTYKLTVNKVEENADGTTSALSGAGFTLYKYDIDIAENDGWVAVGEEITGATTFTWEGLDDGFYMLVETTTPNGYNTMENLYFYVVAEHTEEGITSLVIKDEKGDVISGLEATFTTVASDGAVSTDIVNNKGTNLPGTGGIGTTVFYIVGGILVLGAAVLLITRRRMSTR